MPGDLDVLTHEGRVRLLKRNREQARRLVVQVRDGRGGAPRRLDFPEDQHELIIDGLSPEAPTRLAIRRAGLMRTLLPRRLRLEVRPISRRLRALISGSGRCGTTSVARYLDGLAFPDGRRASARHETLAEYILPALERRDAEAVAGYLAGFTHDIEAAPHFSLVPEVVRADRIVHLIRDGRRVVQSGLNRGWYQNDRIWNRIKPDFPGDPFAKSCHFWAHTNRNLAGVSHRTFRLEDLIASPAALAELVEFIGLAPTERALPAANQGKRSSEAGHWSREQRQTFAQICGELMDRWYPGWRDQEAVGS